MMHEHLEPVPPSNGGRRAIIIIGSLVAVVALVVAVLLVNRGDNVRTTTPTSVTSTSTTAQATTTTATTAPPTVTTAPVLTPPDTSPAVWPVAASGTRYVDPVAAARGFAVDFIGFRDPVVGVPTMVTDRSVVVELRPDATGPVTYVQLHQLDGADTWWVTGATTAALGATQPVSGETITSPVHLVGQSTAFEATFRAEDREDGNPTPLATSPVMGGSNGEMGPYDTVLVYATPSSQYGTVVLVIPSMKDGRPLQVSVTRVRFADVSA